MVFTMGLTHRFHSKRSQWVLFFFFFLANFWNAAGNPLLVINVTLTVTNRDHFKLIWSSWPPEYVCNICIVNYKQIYFVRRSSVLSDVKNSIFIVNYKYILRSHMTPWLSVRVQWLFPRVWMTLYKGHGCRTPILSHWLYWNSKKWSPYPWCRIEGARKIWFVFHIFIALL